MTTYLLAGGGTAGHVNPLLATADAIVAADPDAVIRVLGTAEGLEARLVPLRGYELRTIPRLPFPRRPDRNAMLFPQRFRATLAAAAAVIRDEHVDVVVGFGGYASAPAYVAAKRLGVPIVVHEQNAKPGMANRLGAALTRFVGVTFRATSLRGGRVTGMPLRREIVDLDRAAARAQAIEEFGLAAATPTLLVTGGSSGARSINATVNRAITAILATGWQVLHITGQKSEVDDPGLPGYRMLRYCDRMDLAIAVADLAVSRSGATTVSEFSAVGLPAIYVPYPVGNGEQRFNARDAIDAGSAWLVDDAAFTPEWVERHLAPLLADRATIDDMAAKAGGAAIRDGAERVVALIAEALTASRAGAK